MLNILFQCFVIKFFNNVILNLVFKLIKLFCWLEFITITINIISFGQVIFLLRNLKKRNTLRLDRVDIKKINKLK